MSHREQARHVCGVHLSLLHQQFSSKFQKISQPAADRLAYHYTRGVEAQKAVTFLTLCAEKAVRTHAHAEAATAFEEALAQATRLPETGRERRSLELTLRQTFSWSFLGRFRETLERLLSQQAVLERLADATLRLTAIG